MLIMIIIFCDCTSIADLIQDYKHENYQGKPLILDLLEGIENALKLCINSSIQEATIESVK